MRYWIKKHWPNILAFFTAIPIGLRFFLRHPMLAVGVAAAPVQQFVKKHTNLGPVSSVIVAFLILAGLITISYHVGEVIVLLFAFSLAFLEIPHFVNCIRAHFNKHLDGVVDG